MYLDIYLSIQLTAYGNAVLRGNFPVEKFFPENPTFKNSQRIGFFKTDREEPYKIASDPEEWFGILKENNCESLNLYRSFPENSPAPERQMSAFMGGSSWFVVTNHHKSSSYWLAKPGNRKSLGLYYNVSNEPVFSLNFSSPGEQKEKMKNILSRIHSFASKKGIKNFADSFQKALNELDSDTPLSYNPQFIPTEFYPLEARQLLSSVFYAWVFGGMGSWNDLHFPETEDQKKYGQLSDELFSTLIESIESGANAY
jgi:hypothetical protein